MTTKFRRAEQLSSWRRMALNTWAPPRDPTVYGNLEIDVSRALPYLDKLRRESGVRVTMTHLVAKAIALAIQRQPEANAMIRRRWIYRRTTVDVFVQVVSEGGEELGGVKLENADQKPLVELAAELGERAERIRERRDPELETTKRALTWLPQRLLGPVMRLTDYASNDLGLDLSRFGLKPDAFGSAMVSSIASFGIDWAFAPLVPFSRSPIVLLVGQVRERPIVVEGNVVARPVLLVGATFDHRLLDGAQASRLAKTVCAVIADPESELASPPN